MNGKYFVELKSEKKFPKTEHFTAGDDFFDDEKLDIEGGTLEIEVLTKRLGEGYSLDIAIKGTVKVTCDRCLGIVEIPVESQMQLRAKDDDSLEYDDEDLVLMNPSDTGVDIEWNIYEMALLALPIQRVHKDGECDEEMTETLESYSGETLDEDENATDPRWDGLKALLNKK